MKFLICGNKPQAFALQSRLQNPPALQGHAGSCHSQVPTKVPTLLSHAPRLPRWPYIYINVRNFNFKKFILTNYYLFYILCFQIELIKIQDTGPRTAQLGFMLWPCPWIALWPQACRLPISTSGFPSVNQGYWYYLPRAAGLNKLILVKYLEQCQHVYVSYR